MFASNSSQVSSDAVFIEDVFSTYLYTGNSTSGGTQTITNNIDLSTKGGMVWIKGRSADSDHILSDTARGAGASATNNNALASNLTSAEDLGGSSYDFLSAFNADGFTVKQGGTTTATRGANYNNVTYASWTFRKQAKFFDVVTYTGNGANRTIAHNLGSVPGCIIVKRTDTTGAWQVYHRSLANTEYLVLNTTAVKATGTTRWNSTTPTSTEFSLGTDATVNANGGTYVAYLFAHDAGGFGTAGTDNVISCGTYTGNTSGVTVDLGYEAQLVMIKKSGGSTGANWSVWDVMRGMPVSANGSGLYPNTTNAEGTGGNIIIRPTATGFAIPDASDFVNITGSTYIYIAIRRGPMKTPTSGTSVFAPVTRTAKTTTVTSNTNPDLLIALNRNTSGYSKAWFDKLRGKIRFIASTDSSTEYNPATATLTDWGNTGVVYNSSAGSPANDAGVTYVDYYFTRAPGFFDEVCYTGTGSNTTQTHSLGVVPELIIVKRRDTTGAWDTYSAALANTEYMVLNTTAAKATGATRWNSTTPTSSVFSLGTSTTVNASGGTYVAYLFASLAGVSKVGSYTGTGTTLQINCGFTGGARFVMIKRVDSTGNWFVWDTARGIVSGNDPYSYFNTTLEENSDDYIDPYSAGFELSSTAPAEINASGGTFIYMAIS